MNATTTTVVGAYLATLDEVRDAQLAAVLTRQLAPSADEKFCFVTIDRDHEIFTLAIDGAWVGLGLEIQRNHSPVELDMELPRAALRAVVRGLPETGTTPVGVAPSITMSPDGIPHIAFAA